jgi:ligand-binding sensor domain-containing protein
VYVGTTGGGVDLVTSRSVTRLRAPDGGRFSVSPGGLLLLDDVLFVATLERGLLAYDRREREWLSLPQPMPGAAVTALVADSESLYVGTDRGLMRIDLEALGIGQGE